MRTFSFITFVLLLSACAESELAPAGDDAGRLGNNGMVPMADGGDTGSGVGDSGVDMATSDMSVADLGDDMDEADMGADAMNDMGMTGPCDAVPSNPGWEAVGGPISAVAATSDSMTPDIAVDGDCRPIIAFHEDTASTEENIYVYRFEGGLWQQLGGAIDATGQDDKWTTGVRIATDGDDVFIAWAEINLENEVGVYVARWTGSTWQILGDVMASGLLSFDMSLVVDPQGRPIVAWNARDGAGLPTQVRVARWQDPQWVALGGPLKNDPAKPGASALAPELVIDADGDPVIAWSEDSYIHARVWDGASWGPLNGSPIDAVMNPSGAFDANLALHPNGDVLVGWREAAGSTDIYVEAWDGAAWSVVANALDGESDTSGRTNTASLDIAVDSQGRTTIVWDEPVESSGRERVYVQRHDSSGIAPLGVGILDVNVGETSSGDPQVDVDPVDRVYVTFTERGTSADEVHVWRYTD